MGVPFILGRVSYYIDGIDTRPRFARLAWFDATCGRIVAGGVTFETIDCFE